MRHLPLALAAIWIALLFGVRSVVAGPNNDPIVLYLTERSAVDPVDQQTWCGDCVGPGEDDFTINEPWTVNPGWVDGYVPPIMAPVGGCCGRVDPGCLWDSDDFFEYKSSGNVMGPGVTLTITECRWASPGSRYSGVGGALNYVVWRSASPDLVITYEWDWGEGSKTYVLPPPLRDSSNQWKYQACLWAPPATGGTVIAVPGSHDGDGVWELDTITITNPTDRKTNKTGGIIGSDYRSNGLWCPNGWLEV